jgi:glycosyltransferase involved in cell wall biosynthesis
MKITFVLPEVSNTGGVRAIATYAERLAARGHEVLVVSQPRRTPPLRRKIKSLLSGKGWPKPNVLKHSHIDNAKGITHRVLEKRRPVVASDLPDADVVIATWWETAEWVYKLPPSKGAKLHFVQHHETVFDGQPVERVKAALRLPIPKIACARWIAETMRTDYGQPDTVVIPYGLDHSTFTAPPRDKQATPTVCVMYSTTRFKGCDISLDAVRLARKQIPDLKLVAFGHYDPAPHMPVPDNTQFERQPKQKRIAELYASADALLFGSRCEGYGMPIQEAMACRTPVIGTPTGAAPETIVDGGGIMVEMESVQSMADAIVRIARMSNEEWKAMSDAAHATAQTFDWNRSTDRFEDELKQLVARARRSVA